WTLLSVGVDGRNSGEDGGYLRRRWWREVKGLNWRGGGKWSVSEGRGGGHRRVNHMFFGVWSEGYSRLPEFCSEVFEYVSVK
ncbi:hypothetical protein HAX54_001186, partial [Datura stramonium]|nr:hypothetical protein [Datura stramonium]